MRDRSGDPIVTRRCGDGNLDVAIRPTAASDAPLLTMLAHAAKASWGCPPGWIAAWRDELTLTPDYLEAHRSFVAEVAGSVAGMCAIEDHGARWVIEHLWVDPATQRRGVGAALVTHALATARACQPLPVEVVSDPNAEGFYVRLGARRVGSRHAPMPGAPQRTVPVLEFAPGA